MFQRLASRREKDLVSGLFLPPSPFYFLCPHPWPLPLWCDPKTCYTAKVSRENFPAINTYPASKTHVCVWRKYSGLDVLPSLTRFFQFIYDISKILIGSLHYLYISVYLLFDSSGGNDCSRLHNPNWLPEQQMESFFDRPFLALAKIA